MLTFEQTKGLEDAFGPDKAAPLIDILQGIVQRIDNQKVAVKADLLLELATKADIAALDGKIDTNIAALRADIARLEGKMESDIARLEGKIDADIARLEGKMESDIARLEGKIDADIARLEGKMESDIAGLKGSLDTHVARINGELQSIRLWMKLLVAVGLLGMSLFSPFAVKLLDFLK